MERAEPPTLAESIAAAHGWWREAGVDFAYSDVPTGWLASEGASTPAVVALPEAVAKPSIGGEPGGWPTDLASFAQWWVEEPSLDAGPVRRRVPPRGRHAAALMIVVPMPEADDAERLLSGPQGRLVANMARAMGLASNAVYLASALPRHLPLPDWAALAADGLGDVLQHHVALAAPRRLLVLGRSLLPLIRHDPAQQAPSVSEMSIQSGALPVMSSYAPGQLMDHHRLRAELWRQWLEWTGTAE